MDNVPLMVSRTGFTGDLGYELWIDFDHALEFWDALYTAGENFGIQPYGEEATNMARLEAGFLMPGMEFNEALKTVNFEYDQTPFDFFSSWLINLSNQRVLSVFFMCLKYFVLKVLMKFNLNQWIQLRGNDLKFQEQKYWLWI